MSENWRMSSEVIAIVPHTEEPRIYLASPEKKQYISAVVKNLKTDYDEIRLNTNEFNLRLEKCDRESTCCIAVYVRSDHMPNTEIWFRLMNFKNEHLGYIISDLVSNKGQLDYSFEAVFSDQSMDEVSFTTKEMSNYKVCFEEMRRRLNCEIFTKTKKFIPGHRYDTVQETRYFLGVLKSRKANGTNTEFIMDADKMVDAYLYVNDLKDTDKTISDIFKTRHIGAGDEDIKISYGPFPLMVDSGPALEDDKPVFEGLQQILWANSIKDCTKIIDGGYSYCDIVPALSILGLQSSADVVPDFTYWKPVLEEAVYSDLKHNLIMNFEVDKLREDLNVSSKKTVEENTAACVNLFYTALADTNLMKAQYYKALLSMFGINLNSVAERVMIGWNQNELSKDFDTFLKYNFYFYYRLDKNKMTSTQRVISTSFKIDIVPVESLFPDSEILVKTILDITKSAKDNYGMGVRGFRVLNVGSKKEAKEYIECIISLGDIVRFYGGKDNVPENLKNEILKYKFTWVCIKFNKDKTDLK